MLLVITGILFLLNNFGLLPWNLWELWRLWPLILIFIGLEIILGRSRWGRIVLIASVLAVIIIIVVLLTSGYLGEKRLAPITSERVVKELEGASEVRMEIEFGTGRLYLGELADSSNLMEAEFKYDMGSPRALVSYNVKKGKGYLRVQSEQSKWPFGHWGTNEDTEWNIRLSPRIPLTLHVKAGVGRSTFDLAGLRVSSLDLDAGVGNVRIIFPAAAGLTEAKIDAGVGDVTLQIPGNVGARIHVDMGLGSVQIADRFTKSDDYYISEGYAHAENRLELDIDGGIGRIIIE